ncbi:MAG: uncharacterized protein QOH69_794 [Actinomycetota bacterium]|jgi:uncharacterized membrane protein YraQ (UPF0718 family)/YHS domain-containing protein|nr:uncharacterized protein [Actinomycetota bacterium]
MFWATLWALVFGFALSGIVQSFVSRRDMQKLLGDHKPKAIVRSSLFGMASSSCSYAASALARSLFQRGADFTSAMVFMFASTNLVIELGIVLWLLLGWQFALAEFVGGAIMIALFAIFAPSIFPARQIAEARVRLNAVSGVSSEAEALDDQLPLRQRLRSRSGWVAAAGYAISDLKMLRRELVIGYLVAGVLVVAVPTSIYGFLFLQGHGIWTEIENVIVGPFIAFVSFVCSVGNVPLAAALFKGGFSFGGTIAFIFADLIALPLVIIYARFYGRRLAIRLFFSFWAIMSAAGLLTELLFRLIRIPAPARPIVIAPERFEWNYTTWLDIAFLVIGVVIYVVYRNRDRLASTSQYALDHVCGMQVEKANPGATARVQSTTYYFCCDQCRDNFTANPDRYLKSSLV